LLQVADRFRRRQRAQKIAEIVGQRMKNVERWVRVISFHREVSMNRITTAWTWFRLQIRDLRLQLRLCVRVTVAALLSYVLGKSLNIPLGGLWAVLTAVVVTQVSVGGSLKATIEYLTGTLGGVVYFFNNPPLDLKPREPICHIIG
jgi:uncharacterized membrane protein YccC